MNFEWFIVSGIGLVILGLSAAAARKPAIGPVEVRVFHAVNGMPGWLYPALWLPMQLGNLVVGTLVGLAIAFADGDIAAAVGVVLAMVLKLVVERVVRKRMAAYLAVRQRPGTSQVGAVLRGSDVPSTGASFPSGHVILVAAIGCVVAANMSATWWWIPGILVVAVMVGRVFVGAHNPLDVTAGLGAGLLLGGLVSSFVN